MVTAGVIAGGVPLWEMPEAEIRAVLEVDLEAVITVARAAIPALLRRPEPRSGRFIVRASAAASRGLPMLAAYCAAKAGVVGLTNALAAELRGTGVTANAVRSGVYEHGHSGRECTFVRPSRMQKRSPRSKPIERLIEPEEIAENGGVPCWP